MPNKYIGLTIGPLHKTMTRVRATRELWASSYIFSYIMKKMIEKLKDERKFIIPYAEDPTIFDKGQEVGLFHDRFIFEAKDDDFERVEQIKNEVLHELSENISHTISVSNSKKIFDFLDRYFQIYFCELELTGDYKEVNEKVNNYLDSLELQAKFIKEADKNYLMELFDKINMSFLMEDAYGKGKHSFPYLAKIAAKELSWEGVDDTIDRDDTDSDIYNQLKKINGDKFKQYHKYIAIVQADGDNLGATIKSLKDDPHFGKFSQALLLFSKEAHRIITEHGGTTIFAGGDDLLFFAPVVYKGKNVFQLTDDLAKEFYCSFKEFDQSPTLSVGISITYYKYPMSEALESASNLLFAQAKKRGGRNAIAYEVQKHSGQRIAGVFNRADEDYKKFMDLINKKEEKKMLTSVIHKLAFHGAVIDEIGTNEIQLKNYFDNFFNESEHKKYETLLNDTAGMIKAIYDNPRSDKKKELVFSVLRLKKFLEGGE